MFRLAQNDQTVSALSSRQAGDAMQHMMTMIDALRAADLQAALTEGA